MANKTSGTRQKLSFRIEPSQQFTRPRNPVAEAARLRAAGSHRKTSATARQAARQEVRRMLEKPEPT